MTVTPSPQSVIAELLEHSVTHYGHPKDETCGVGLVHAQARALLAAPAPSSLAGGEWRPNPGYNPLPGERVDIRWGGEDAGRTKDDGDLSDLWSWDLSDGEDQTDTIQMWRPHVAALSPEAPAREGVALERALKSLRALQDGAATAMPAFEGNEAVYDFLCAIHREAVKGQLASDDVTNEAALTPHHEAPAEGAGEDILERLRDIHRRNPSEYAECCSIIDALRARSSASEAREGEVVGPDSFSAEGKFFLAVDYLTLMTWRWGESCGIDSVGWDDTGDSYNQSCRDDHRKARRAVVDAFHAAVAEKIAAHPAAPSADKLRGDGK